ncbi:MtrAB system response regulator MtrA [Actinomyces oricola]|uniref:MtrAB system response regulator MtrA n=1 Tax=Actinomyces oricola TaxID=206043 RepID=UPI000FFEB9E6|nr:MtrAB system response regulator MtrA [Actinomyces oricola]
MSTRILVVDDDTALAEMIGIMLEAEGYLTSFCPDGAAAMEAFRTENPDLVLLDLMLPGLDGVEICRLIRAESDVPVIMLTARTDTQDVVAGLEAGADDYVTKPFKSKELLARVRTRLRRNPDGGINEHVRAGDLDIDVAGHQIYRGQQLIALTPLEFELLVTLARQPWRVFSREELLEKVWGYQHAADTRLVNVHVQRLRSKIEIDPEHPAIVVTVRGVGYRVSNDR